MKKIGAGLQFDVYDLGNGRVLKKPKKRWKQYLIYLKWSPLILFRPKKFCKIIQKANQDREFATKFFSKNKINFSILGNPDFIPTGVEQDKVIPLRKLFGQSEKEDKKLVDKYVECVFSCWREGFADRIYNIDNNFGLNKNGKMVLLDFFEITLDKSEVKKEIEIKRWEKAAWYKYRIPKRVKKYYKEKLEKNLTPQNLNKYWKKK